MVAIIATVCKYILLGLLDLLIPLVRCLLFLLRISLRVVFCLSTRWSS